MLRAFSGYIVSSVLFLCVHPQKDDGRVIFVGASSYYSNSQPKEAYITREIIEGPSYYQRSNKAETLQIPYDDYTYRSSQDAYLFQNSQQNYQQQQQQQYQQQPQNAYSQLQNSRGTQQGSVFYPDQSNERYTSVLTQVPSQGQSYQPLKSYTTRIPQEVTKVYTYQPQVYTTRPPKTSEKSNVYQAHRDYTTRTSYTTSKLNTYRPQNTYTTTVTPHLSQSFSYQSQNVPTQHRTTNSYTLKPYTTRVPVAITKSSLYVSQDAYTTRPPKVSAKPVTLSRLSSPRPTTKPWVPSKTIIITQSPSVRLDLQDTRTPPIARIPVKPFQLVPSRSNQSPENTRNRGVSPTTDRNSVIPESQFSTSRPSKIPPYSNEVSDKGTLPNFDHLDCACPRNLNPVCASNGLTYPNDCVFKCALKKDNPDLILRHKGICSSTATTTTTTRGNLESVLTLVD